VSVSEFFFGGQLIGGPLFLGISGKKLWELGFLGPLKVFGTLFLTHYFLAGLMGSWDW